MSTLEEILTRTATKEVEIRNSIATIIVEDLWFQEEIENILDDKFPKLFNRRPSPTLKEENEISKHLIDAIYRKVESVLNCKHSISDIVNDKNTKYLRLTRSSMIKIQALYTQKDKVDIEKIEQRKGRGRPLPPWLLTLKRGQYTVNELVEISKTDKRNIQKIMKKYCTKISYIDVGDCNKKSVYHWEKL